jgi:hypothetical protein
MSFFVPSNVRDALTWRKAKNVTVDQDTEAMMVQVGPPVPVRLLLLHSGEDNLITIQLWEVKKAVKVLVTRKTMTDLLPEELLKVAKDYLGG